MSMPEIDRDANLFEAATRLDRLEEAWERVRRNAGCAGADGITIAMFAQRAASRLLGLQRRLRDGTYQPQPLRLFEIPKPDGSFRQLAVPAVADRIAQTAVTLALNPVIDPALEDVSFAYRPGRSVSQAIETIRRYREQGFQWVLEGDVEKYFDRIPHEPLLKRLEQALSDYSGHEALIDLIGLWLEAGALSLDSPATGIAQGSPLSPLLSNLYLDAVDEHFVQHHAKLRLVRFADDFVILAREQAKAAGALEIMRQLLAEHGLGLNPEKTRIASFDHGFRFLGHVFVRSMIVASPNREQEDQAPDTAEQLLRWIAERDAEQAAAEAKLATERAAGLEPGLRVLYVREPGRTLSLRNEAFTVLEQAPNLSRELIAIPHQRIDRIEIGPECAADDAAIRQALATDTVIHFVNGRGETVGVLAPPETEHAGLHLAQARVVMTDESRIDLARRIVDGRLRNQRALLHRLNRRHQQQEVISPLTQLSKAIRRLAVAADVPELLGHEGAAAALYWRALVLLVQPDWAVTARGAFKRQRRPAPDAFTVVLNYLAALLGRDLFALALRHGLHPGFGALHSASDGEHACVYDLMEEFRAPLAEGLCVYLFNNRILNKEMFTRLDGGAIRMSREGHGPIIRGYEGWLDRDIKSPRTGTKMQWRRLIEEQVVAYAQHCRGGAPYRAYVMDY
jgi:CRISPR-associated protein Cas1